MSYPRRCAVQRANLPPAMARKPQAGRGKRVVFDEETWHALDLLMLEQMKSFDDISAEAFRDLLRKYGQPKNLKAALKQSLREARQPSNRKAERRLPSPRRKKK